MRKQVLEQYLNSRRRPVTEIGHAEQMHSEFENASLEAYVAVVGDSQAHLSHRTAAFIKLLSKHEIESQVVVENLANSSIGDLVTLLESLRLYRKSGRRARSIGLRALLGHSGLAEYAASSRNRAARLLKHLLGERTWSSIVRALGEVRFSQNSESVRRSNRFLRRTVLKFTNGNFAAIETLQFVAGVGLPKPTKTLAKKPERWLIVPWLDKSNSNPIGQGHIIEPKDESLAKSSAARRNLEAGEGMPLQTLSGIRGTFFPNDGHRQVRQLAQKKADCVEVGTMTRVLKRVLENEALSVEELRQVSTLRRADPRLRINTEVTVVVDMSGSMASSGSRMNHPAALAQAIVGILQKSVAKVNVHQVGGTQFDLGEDFPVVAKPCGQSDLARVLLDASKTEASAILVITDGFENFRQGDTDAVVRGLREVGYAIPICQVTPVLSLSEDLASRRLGDSIPVVPIEHEDASKELVARVHLASKPNELTEEEVRAFCEIACSGVA